jgi:hypothetical protein
MSTSSGLSWLATGSSAAAPRSTGKR